MVGREGKVQYGKVQSTSRSYAVSFLLLKELARRFGALLFALFKVDDGGGGGGVSRVWIHERMTACMDVWMYG